MAQTVGIDKFVEQYSSISQEQQKILKLVIDHVTECSISVTTDMRDITTKTSGGYRELLPGLKSASMSVSGLFAEDATNGYNQLLPPNWQAKSFL